MKNKDTIKSRQKILNLYHGWRLRIILEKTTQKFSGPFKKHWHYLTATFIAILILSGGFFINNYYFTKAATFTWLQESWSGGETANTADHNSNQTGWTEYESADSSLTIGDDISITPTEQTTTHTDDVDFDGTHEGTKTETGSVMLDL